MPQRTETVKIGKMYGIMENSGRTPAVQMIVNAVWTGRKAGEEIPDYDSIEKGMTAQLQSAYRIPSNIPADLAAEIAKTMEIVKKQSSPTPTVLPPSAVRPIANH